MAAATDGPATEEVATTSELIGHALAQLRRRVREAHQRRVHAHDAGRAQPLEGARGNQRAQRIGEGGRQRRQREHRHAHQVHAPVAHQVAQRGQRQQHDQRGDLVGVDHPDRLRRAGLQLARDARQRQVDDGAVEHRHDQPEDDDQHGPAAFGRGEPVDGLAVRVVVWGHRERGACAYRVHQACCVRFGLEVGLDLVVGVGSERTPPSVSQVSTQRDQRAGGHAGHHGQRPAVGEQAHHRHGQRAREHLQRAQQRRGRAGNGAVHFERQHAGGRNHQAHEARGDEVQRNQHPHAVAARGEVDEHRDHGRAAAHHAELDEVDQPVALAQRTRELRGPDEGRRVHAEGHAVQRGRQAVVVDHHERRIGQVGEEARHREAADEHQPR
jgi:hypothetical protein